MTYTDINWSLHLQIDNAQCTTWSDLQADNKLIYKRSQILRNWSVFVLEHNLRGKMEGRLVKKVVELSHPKKLGCSLFRDIELELAVKSKLGQSHFSSWEDLSNH